MLSSKSIGSKIAAARRRINISQAELAMQIPISPQAVGKWERGESMPDLLTLNRLAELLGVDLNYFSENFPTSTPDATPVEPVEKQPPSAAPRSQKHSRDMSRMILVDSDFSGLKDLHERLSSTIIQRCLFIGADMRGLTLNSSIADQCNFSNADMSSSRIQDSVLGNSTFRGCSLKEAELSKNLIGDCDFSDADFTNATLRSGTFGKNIMSNAKLKSTSFIEMQIQDIAFEGTLEGCSFEGCTFHGVIKFENATLINTFFKNNNRFKRVQFIGCKADRITYAFLKNNFATLTGITVLPE